MPGVGSIGAAVATLPQNNPPALKRQELLKTQPVAPAYSDNDNLSLRAQIDRRLQQTITFSVPLNSQVAGEPVNNLKQADLFHQVYRNFDLLPENTQNDVLTKLNLFIDKYPDFLERLNNVDNPKYGKGFQFYFIPPEQHERWEAIPTAVRGTGGYTDYIGIVYSNPITNALPKDGLLGAASKAMTYLSIGVTHVMGKVKESAPDLDVGGMFTDVTADTFSHEMAHAMHAYVLSNEEKLEIWAIYAEAEDTGEGFITNYAKTNHFEFFAEGVEAYMHQNHKGEFDQRADLLKTNPKLYNFVQRLIEPGVERQAGDTWDATFTILKAKAKNAAEAVRNLDLDFASKKDCKCGKH